MTEFINGIFYGVFVLLPMWIIGLLILVGLVSVITDWIDWIKRRK